MSTQRFRLASGGRIDRARTVEFTFDGKRMSGYRGDTLASALLANGVHLVGRSFKYHRPRGIVTCGAEEPNALVQLGRGAHTEPNIRATQVELYEGLEAAAQNCWPSLAFDAGAVNDVISRLIPAGFYYKTFMWPRGMWMRYEHFIRKAAGLGRAPEAPDPDLYDKMHDHCDVLVAGGGPAGLAAALAAARAGARVIVADEQAEPGGSLLGVDERIDDRPAMAWIEATLAELAGMADVRVLPRCTVVGYYDHNYLTMVERLGDHLTPAARTGRARQRLWKIRARQVILATGAHERPLVFRNNDRPGIMLASAARTYVNRYGVLAGRTVVVFTNNDSAYDAAADLSQAGSAVTVVDARAEVSESRREALRRRGVEVLAGHAVVEARGTRRVRAVEMAPLDAAGAGYAGSPRTLECDLVCMSGGWNPSVHLFSQSRGRLSFDDQKLCFVPGESVQAERSVGAASGTFQLAYALSEGREAGKAAAADAGFRRRGSSQSPRVELEEETPPRALWVVPPRLRDGPLGKHFVDFQNDVTAADIGLAVREGYRS
ncbi:MAG: 2Fe-2S iron-sulfur cluster-binding protein, partial [Gammaproteobacteria bacterium]|nr:2Fe-2S iron-sulfur cluster-binding protein [Gammaproteobacteria bacterium]